MPGCGVWGLWTVEGQDCPEGQAPTSGGYRGNFRTGRRGDWSLWCHLGGPRKILAEWRSCPLPAKWMLGAHRRQFGWQDRRTRALWPGHCPLLSSPGEGMQLPPGVLGRDLAGTGLEGPLQPGTLTAVLSSCVFFLKEALGCVQDESLPLPWEEALDACGNRGPDGAPGPRGLAGAWGALRGHPLMGRLSYDILMTQQGGGPWSTVRKLRLREVVLLA